ncbi:MAG: hypothetical protein KAX80_00940 [Planctomycetes bacterium]|nr:hypothetical protein [Planctomycetota bacterium]
MWPVVSMVAVCVVLVAGLLWVGLKVRFLLYLVVAALMFEALALVAQAGHGYVFVRENEVWEWAQVGFLVLASLFFYWAARRRPRYGKLFALLCVLPLVAAVRELDDVLDTYVFDNSWKVIVGLLLLYAGYITWRNFARLKVEFRTFMETRAFGFLWCGFVVVFIFSRLFGQKVLWKALMGEHYLPVVARTVEEGCELLGYWFILTGALECLLQAPDQEPLPPTSPNTTD